MKKIIAFVLAALMMLSLAACGSNSGNKTDPSKKTTEPTKTASVQEVYSALQKALGENGFHVDTELEKEMAIARYGLDAAKVKNMAVYESSLSFMYMDNLAVFQVEDGYQKTAVEGIQSYLDQLVSYSSMYGVDIAKVQEARIYQSGDIVALIILGNSGDENTSAEDAAKLIVESYKTVDETWTELFGALPENQAVINESESDSGGMIGG